MLLDRRKVKYWQKWVFGFMAIIMAGFLVMIPVSGRTGCGESTSSSTKAITQDIAKYKAAVKADRKDADSWSKLGESYLYLANQQTDGSNAETAALKSSAAAYERAAKLLAKEKGKAAETQRIKTLEQLGVVYMQLKDYETLTSVYGQLTELRPRNAEYFFYLGQAAINAGDTNTAMLALGKYLKLEPNSADAAAVREWIKENKASSSSSTD